MILKNPYNPLTHLRAIKNLFFKPTENDEIISEVNEEHKTETFPDKGKVLEIDYSEILQDMANIILDYDLYLTQVNDDNTKSLIIHLQDSILDLMVKYGAEEFTDTNYHSLSDIVVPFCIVEEMTPIQKTIRPGLKYKDIILLRSQVMIN